MKRIFVLPDRYLTCAIIIQNNILRRNQLQLQEQVRQNTTARLNAEQKSIERKSTRKRKGSIKLCSQKKRFRLRYFCTTQNKWKETTLKELTPHDTVVSKARSIGIAKDIIDEWSIAQSGVNRG